MSKEVSVLQEIEVKETVRALLSEIIDYAGLFPPSGVPMAAAVQNFTDYLRSDYAWMLGRFVLPLTRLEEFVEHAEGFFLAKKSKLWRISILADEDFAATLDKVESFNSHYQNRAIIDTLEIKIIQASEITAKAKRIPENITAFFEIPQLVGLSEYITPLALTRSRAKIRTGGLTQEAFPPIDELVKFLRVCMAANVPFKATAGLHHPLRCQKPLTYEPDAPSGLMHGFLNLFLSAAFLRQNLNNTFVHELMADTSAEDLRFDDTKIYWKKHELDVQQVLLMRKRGAISFGSCSFIEPIEELQQLSVIS